MGGRFPVGKRKTVQAQQDGSVQKRRSLAAPAREKKIREGSRKSLRTKPMPFCAVLSEKHWRISKLVLRRRHAASTKLPAQPRPCCRCEHAAATVGQRKQFGRPSRRTNEAISRPRGFCRWAFVPWSALIPAAAGGGDCAVAPGDFDWHGQRGDCSRTGSIGRPRLPAPRRAQHLLVGPGSNRGEAGAARHSSHYRELRLLVIAR